MALSNQERVGKAMELLREGLAPFAERMFKGAQPTSSAPAPIFAAEPGAHDAD